MKATPARTEGSAKKAGTASYVTAPAPATGPAPVSEVNVCVWYAADEDSPSGPSLQL